MTVATLLRFFVLRVCWRYALLDRLLGLPVAARVAPQES